MKSQKQAMIQVKKHDSPEGSMTQFWHPTRDSKRNQLRQPADVEMDMDSHRKIKMKDPNSEEGDTEGYQMNLSGGTEPKACTSKPQEFS